MKDALSPYKSFFSKIMDMRLDSAILVTAVQKMSADHHDDIYRQSNDVIIAIDGIIVSDFNSITKSNVITLYAYLEATIKDLIKELLVIYHGEGKLLDIPEIAKITISLTEFMSISDEEKFDYLLSEYEKKTAVGTSYSVDRFEKLLTPFKLSQKIDAGIKKSIMELAQYRNCLIHKAGIVDRQLLTQCHWLKSKYKVGQQLKVTAQDLVLWMEATTEYCQLIENKINELFGE